eukprot:scaffold5261_cov108-Skeletonema_menzelii.AAC.1
MRFGLASSALLIGIATIAFVDGEGTSITNDNDDSMKAKAQFGGAGEVPSDHQRALLVQPSASPSPSASATTSSYSFTKVGDGSCNEASYLVFTGKATREDCESQCSSCPGGQLTGINLIGYGYWQTGKFCLCYLDGVSFSETACNNDGKKQVTGTGRNNVCTVPNPPNGWVCYKADTSPVCPTPSPRPSVSPTQETQSPSSWPSASPTTSAMPIASPTTNSKAKYNLASTEDEI